MVDCLKKILHRELKITLSTIGAMIDVTALEQKKTDVYLMSFHHKLKQRFSRIFSFDLSLKRSKSSLRFLETTMSNTVTTNGQMTHTLIL